MPPDGASTPASDGRKNGGAGRSGPSPLIACAIIPRVSADDDPEARIRELERPLSDFAKAAEVTVSSAGAEQVSPTAGNGRGIGVAVRAMAAVFVTVAAAAMFLISRGPTGTTPGFPTVPSTAAPTPSRSVPVVPPASASPANPTPGRADTITVSGAGQDKTLACAGNQVSVSGVRNTITLTGRCAGLTVSGIGNVITVDFTPAITTSGVDNRVTYRFGDPEVSTSGFDNVVVRG
ncbi:hypothetical protein MNVM_03540 [Mycobacterium novum]|uniref:DUF3060 domain-containing protein n=2 Tax=Mycobacteriaceae TaxID=1762 RepID=A0A7I9Y737_MYCAL|nr:hypothetical protein MNVM_03540 [Mycobacterium novum]GFG84490.1 hypothetical protein MALGJ_11660 [Mycolicibacter algericus]